mmetsp:Transcript_11500/g.12632  ORF Transcript_11500/g.12632 Transcript_11500/m.12632 type:complete len:471 (+) Transcript_11500:43-1455(+)
MGGKKKGGAKKKKIPPLEDAVQQAGAVNDPHPEQEKLDMRMEVRELVRIIQEEKTMAGKFQQEREKINYFWIIEKKNLEDKKAESRNKDRELQDKHESHQIELKTHKQRVKHLLFQNQDQVVDLKKAAEMQLKISEDDHRTKERELKADRRALNVQLKEKEVCHEDFLRALKRDFHKKITAMRQEYERKANDLKTKYKEKMNDLRQDMEDARKAITKQIEDNKTKHINDITHEHAQKLQDIKNYFSEITRTNIDFIKQSKDRISKLRADEAGLEKKLMERQIENKKYSDPLKEAVKDVERLRETKEQYESDKEKLEQVKDAILSHERDIKSVEWEYEVLLQKFQYLDRDRKDIMERFNSSLYEIMQKTGLKNIILQKKIETLTETLETKDVQLNQVLSTANIDPRSLGVIASSVEEVESLKNEQIQEIQGELKKIREAHSNMVKTYEGKLSEFGIPVEELGFDPLVPANM